MAELALLTRTELFTLRAHYYAVAKDELSFYFQYFNFYVGLLSAILAATVAALVQLRFDLPSRGIVLLVGPLLILLLSFVGYRTVRVFYRRYVEAWITTLNVDHMLGLKPAPARDPEVGAPRFASKFGGGFIAEFERKPIREMLDKAEREKWVAEEVLSKVLAAGDTLRFARSTFGCFATSASIAGIVIVTLVLG
jgi:hypothetical protein